MKPLLISSLIAISTIISTTPWALADENHGHDHDHSHADGHEHAEKKPGPNGGRIIDAGGAKFEFLVTPERKIKITFLDADGAAIKPTNQKIKAVGGSRNSPTRLTFAQDGDTLISDAKLPAGDEVPIILMVKSTSESKTEMERFTVNLEKCPTCEYAEYACICAH